MTLALLLLWLVPCAASLYFGFRFLRTKDPGDLELCLVLSVVQAFNAFIFTLCA